MRRVIRYALIGVVALAATAYLGIAGFLAYNENSMVYGGANLGEEWPYVPPDTVTIPWDTLRVQAHDGVPVFLLESQLAAEEQPWAIFFHGNGQLVGDGNCVAHYRLLRKAGFNVLAVEYRGYGMARSTGLPSEDGVYADAEAGWAYLTEQREVDPDRIVLYGISLGSGIATRLALQAHPAGLITEGAFTTLPAIGQEIYPWLPISLIMQNRFDNLDRAESLSLPWLLFHSRNDEVIPFSHGQSLAAAAPDVHLVELSGSHSGSVIQDEEVALSAMRDFAEQVFEPTHNPASESGLSE
jgi:pimeloyl-ACP methyl ester carboxylesterase